MKLYDVYWLDEKGEHHRFVRMAQNEASNLEDLLFSLQADEHIDEYWVKPIENPMAYPEFARWMEEYLEDELGLEKRGKKQDWSPRPPE